MALECSLQDQLFGHACGDEAMQRIRVREGEERQKSKAQLNLGKKFCGLKNAIRASIKLPKRYEFVFFSCVAFDRSWRRDVAGEYRVGCDGPSAC